MPIFFKKEVQYTAPIKKPELKVYNSFADLIKKANKEEPLEAVVPSPVQKTKLDQPEKQVETDTKGLIKPKYVEDKSVYYKTSSYLRELLGEGD